MTELPVGVVTFLLTDIEASTRRWELEPDAMRQAMARHDDLFEHAVERHEGVVVKPRGEGDSRFSVFPRASNAVAAAIDFQTAFSHTDWPTSTPPSVRMALHTGEADLRDGDYYGTTVNRCARIRSLAYGGQTLLSLATAQLVRESLPDGATLRDLGQHRLKDLSVPENVFQLVIPGISNEFPALQSLDRRPTNLPVQPTPFIGREHLVDQVREWILEPDSRLVTLIGPGGSGKTRLGLQVAASLVDEFADGVFMVRLEALDDPELIIQSIAQTIGVRESAGASLLEAVNEYLGDKDLLLLLDNFERLVSGGSQLTDLLAVNPGLKLLATSRVTLQLRGEREFVVPPLELPGPVTMPSVDRLMEYEAVRLFVSRAQDVKPDFELTAENASAVVEICRRLDGLPLALELAAARVRLFPPQALLKRLERRLPLLTGGARDLPIRQQTLRDTIAWSYDLLEEPERALFRRLSVFASGFTLAAAISMTNAAEAGFPEPTADDLRADLADGESDAWLASIEVFDCLESLVTRSLLRRDQSDGDDSEDPRFGMYETIREFGLEQLEAAGELGPARRAHAWFFLMIAIEAEPELDGPDQGVWLQRLEQEHANLRAALTCALDGEDAELGMRLTGALLPFWEVRGYFTEGRDWTERMLALSGEPGWRAKILTGAGTMAWLQGDVEIATRYHSEALELYQQLHDEEGVASALKNLGVQAFLRNDFERAEELYDQSLAMFRQLGDDAGVSDLLINLGVLATERGNYERSESLLRESLVLRRRVGDIYGVAITLHNMGDNDYYQHHYDQAISHYHESLSLHRDVGSPAGILLSLGALVGIVAMQGRVHCAARLIGAIDALRAQTGIVTEEEEFNRFLEAKNGLRAELGEADFETLWEEGKTLSLDQAIELAMSTSTHVES